MMMVVVTVAMAMTRIGRALSINRGQSAVCLLSGSSLDQLNCVVDNSLLEQRLEVLSHSLDASGKGGYQGVLTSSCDRS